MFLSVVVCEGVVADDDDEESCLSCLKIFLSLSIALVWSLGCYGLEGEIEDVIELNAMDYRKGRLSKKQELPSHTS